jgi:predicted N-acetyltransferase YhbS
MEEEMTYDPRLFEALDAVRCAPERAPAGLPARGSTAIVDETPKDVEARERLLDEAFGPARFLKTCERLRAGRLPARGLALVAKAGERVVGTMRMWPVHAGIGRPALLLGPLAVARDCRSLGLGAALIEDGLARAKARNHRAVLLVGDAPYYARFGFDQRFTRDLVLPGPVERERFLGLELAEGALEGASGRVMAVGARAHALAAGSQRRSCAA